MNIASQTLAAVERVKAKHPFAASGDIATSRAADSLASAIWQRLRAVSDDALVASVASLSAREVRAVCYGATPILGEPGVLERLAVLLDLRGEHYYRQSAIAWLALLHSDGDTRLRPTAAKYLATRPEMTYWHALLEHPKPLTPLLNDYLNGRQTFDSWLSSSRISLDRHHLLEQELIRRALKAELPDTLLAKEGSPVIDRWLNAAYNEAERIEWHVRYLLESDDARWHPTSKFLERILDRYRLPNDGHSFWSVVPERRQEAFWRWVRNRELTSLLGEGERVQFWRRFLSEIERSQDSHDGAAVFIVFRSWFAVQFKETGKATFMLPRNCLVAVRRLAEAQLYRYVLDHTPLGRYTHQGYNWEYGAQREVRRVLQSEAQA